MRFLLLIAAGLAGLMAAACGGGDDKADGQATAALSPVAPPASGAVGLPCEMPTDVKSYRYTWRFKLEVPNGEDMARDLEATARAGQGGWQNDPLGELAMLLVARLVSGAADIRMDAAAAAPDRHEVRIRAVDLDYRLIAIGQEAWVKVGQGDWEESPTVAEAAPLGALPRMCGGLDAVVPGLPGPFGPLFPDLPGLFPEQRDEAPEAVVTPDLPHASGMETGEEAINGIETVHYSAELTDIAEILDFLAVPVDDPEALEALGDARYDLVNMTFDWWLAKEGNWPVRMEFAASARYEEGGDFREYGFLEVKDLNDPNIEIEPPDTSD